MIDLYPAIDIRDGGAVRLVQGDFDRQSEYGDPLDLARQFAAAGARWLHVVDLDAARAGRPVNRATVLAIAAALDVPVQSGGGVRSEEDVEELLAGGVTRVVLGTLALDDPARAGALAERHPGGVAVGIDYRLAPGGRTEVAIRGWEESSGRTVDEVLRELEGTAVAAVVVTAIERDGMLGGPDEDGLRQVLLSTDLPVIASGGVASVSDVERLARLDVASGGKGPERTGGGVVRKLAGVISGRALVEGRMTVEEGVAACARFG